MAEPRDALRTPSRCDHSEDIRRWSGTNEPTCVRGHVDGPAYPADVLLPAWVGGRIGFRPFSNLSNHPVTPVPYKWSIAIWFSTRFSGFSLIFLPVCMCLMIRVYFHQNRKLGIEVPQVVTLQNKIVFTGARLRDKHKHRGELWDVRARFLWDRKWEQ